jgi:DNA-binding NtrC family response regulator
MGAKSSQRRNCETVCVCSGNAELPTLLGRTLGNAWRIQRAESANHVLPLLEARQVSAVLLDVHLGPQLFSLLESLRLNHPQVPAIALAHAGQQRAAKRAVQAGSDEIITVPDQLGGLAAALDRALQRRRVDHEELRLRQEVLRKYSFCGLVGGSEPMQLVYEAITRVADAATTVILRGESGTGKELVAGAIIASGQRRDKPFVSINCAAIPETLIEAELFGHEKGAFTGAHASRPGHIEAAHTGTLFLDEISSLDLGLQGKLLRALEQRTVLRVGSSVPRKIDFRLITATNDDLETMVQAGRFREDLYYRVNVVPIHIPPLRDRQGDIPLLLDHFLRVYCAMNGTPLKRVEPDVVEVLEEYQWPGNVREFENLVQRLVLMTEGGVITVTNLPQQILVASTSRSQELLIPEEGIDFHEEMARIETAYLHAALQRTGGKKVAAATLLKLNRQQMKYLCRKYGI